MPRLILLSFLLVTGALAQERAQGRDLRGSNSHELTLRDFQVGWDEREALVAIPTGALRKEEVVEGENAGPGAPLVLVFHGHGGNAKGMARSVPVHKHWPEAVVVYPQGLKTPGPLGDPEGKKSGWRVIPGEEPNRDVALVDQILKDLGQELVLDPKRMHSTGHSNGAGFTYLLWRERGEVFASFAPSAGRGSIALEGEELVPRPLLHFGSPSDRVVRWTWQESALKDLRLLHRCAEPEPWEPVEGVVRYASPTGAHVYLLEHDGGHRMFPGLAGIVTTFFREHPVLVEGEQPDPDPPGEGSGEG